jgi:hypothetical protein
MPGMFGDDSRRPYALQRLHNSSRRDGSIIAPDGVRRSERNPGKASKEIPSALAGRIE